MIPKVCNTEYVTGNVHTFFVIDKELIPDSMTASLSTHEKSEIPSFMAVAVF
jgi:hypothetical protein